MSMGCNCKKNKVTLANNFQDMAKAKYKLAENMATKDKFVFLGTTYTVDKLDQKVLGALHRNGATFVIKEEKKSNASKTTKREE